MTKLDLAIAELGYVLDCLMTFRNIVQTGSCNDCRGMKEKCDYRPLPGQMVRYNCPFYQKEEEKK